MSTTVAVANENNASAQLADLPAIGTALAGGYYTGIIKIGGQQFALITAGAAGHLIGKLQPGLVAVEGASDRADGHANTEALAAAGSAPAKAALELTINGYSDWYIPSRDEQELQYRAFKPTTEENYADGEDGINPSSVPVGEAYTDEFPVQTTVENFREGAADAFEDWWYWSSTQHASGPSGAWGQVFLGGSQIFSHEASEGRVRVVRRLPIQ